MDKKRLQNYIYLRREIENQQERLARMKNEEKLPAPRMDCGGTQHTGSANDRMANAIVRRLEYESEIADSMEGIRVEMASIRGAIAKLQNPMEREVLRLRYCDGDYCRHMPWRDVALKIYGDDDEGQMQAVYRLHGRALQSIREIEA